MKTIFLIIALIGSFSISIQAQNLQEYKIITVVESIVPAGIGRSRMIENQTDINIDDFTTERTDGKRQIVSAELADLADPRGLVFDLDGTLVDTVETRIRAWLETFEEVGLVADREHVARLIGADGTRLAHEVAAVAGRELEGERAEAIDRRAGEIFGRLNASPRPLPGARELLLALEAGDLPWAIATSSRAEQVQVSIDALRLTRPPLVVDGSQVEHAKPAPDLMFRAAERISVPAPDCWCVGDSTWDVLAAEAAAMTAIGVPTGAVPAQALLDAGATAVTSLEALTVELRRSGLAPRRQPGSS